MRVRSKLVWDSSRCARPARAGWTAVFVLALLWGLPLGAAAQSAAGDSTATPSEMPSATQSTSATQPVPAGHHHSNFSKTGPGPTGALVKRSEAESERLYQHLKGLYMSPYCPGLTLGSCGSGGAELLRADLREWVFEGHKEQDITRYMIATFGDEIMGRPPFRGTAILVWVAPIVAVLIGLWLSMGWIRRNSRPKPAPQGDMTAAQGRPPSVPADKDMDPELEARIEAEIRAREI